MALVRFDTPWDSQPQEAAGVDWANSLAAGLVEVLLPTADYAGVNRTITGTGTKVIGTAGVGINATPAAGITSTRARTAAWSRLHVFRVQSLAAQNNLSVVTGGANTVHLFVNTSGQVWLENAFATILFDGAIVITAGKTHTLLIANDGTGDIGGVRCYVDGKAVSFISFNRSSTSTGTALKLTDATSGGSSSSVDHFLHADWNRCFSEAEGISLSENPWQLFAPLPSVPFVSRTPQPIIRHVLPWDSQPQEAVGVDWSNPLAASLGFLYDGASGREVARNFSIDEGKVAQGVGRAGRGQYSPSTNLGEGHLVFDTDANTSFANITVFALFEPTADPGVNTFFFSRGTQTTPTFGLGVSGGAAKGYRFALNGVVNPDFNGNPIVDIGTVPLRPAFLAMTYDGTSLRCYVDGVDVGGSSGHGAISQDGPSNGVTLFDYVYRSTSIGILYLAGVCSKAFSAQEIAQLSANPWQLFAPRQIWIPATAAASFNPTLSLPTYVPGSLTSSAFRPRVTATWS